MRSYRKPSPPMGAVLLPLLVHLLFTSRIGDAASSVTEKPARGRIILEEVIVSGDNARASAVATDSTQIDDEILSLLSKRETRKRRASRPSKADQDASQSRTVIVDVRNDEVDLERLKHAIAEYEPRRITARKTKRKIIDGSSNATHDAARGGSGGGSATTDFQRIYQEVLRNISRTMIPQLIPTNAPAFNPYAVQMTKSSSQATRVPEATVSDDVTKKKSPDYHVDSFHTLPATLTLKKTKKKLAKKYPQANHHIAAASRLEGDNSGSGDEGRFKANNASLSVIAQSPSIVYSGPPTEEPSSSSHRESSTATPSLLTFSSAPNLSNGTYEPSNLNIPSEHPYLASLSYNALPRPFSVSENVADNVDVSQRKVANFHLAERPHVARPAGNVLPLVLPTDLTPPRRYVPIKRANLGLSHGNPAKIVSSVTSPPTNPPASTSGQPSADYGDVIGSTRSPLVANGPDQSSGHQPTTGNPAESSASTAAAETSALTYDRQITRKNDLLPRVNTQGAKSEPNFNIGLALYNKFANMYSANGPSAVAQDYQNFQQSPSQRAPVAPYYSESRKPNSPLLKIPPVSAVKPALAPYYDSRLLVSPPSVGAGIADERDNKGGERTNERSRVKDEDGAVDDPGKKPASDQTRPIDRETFDTPKRQREQEEDSEEDGASQQRPRGSSDQQRGHSREESDERAKYESDEDEEESDETQRGQYVSSSEESESEPKRSYHYDKYDREDPEEEQRRDDKRKNHHGDAQRNDASSERYSDARYGAESYKQSGEARYDRKNDHRRDDDRREGESVAEDEEEKSGPIFRRAKDRDGPRRKYEKKRLDDGYKYRHHHRETAPPRDSRREERRREEYGESNPRHVRKEYHRARDDHHRMSHGDDKDDDHDDHVRGETREHKHTEHHDKKKDGGGDHNFEEGKGDEFEEEHQGHEGEKGHKGYKVWHEHEKADKGHHNDEHASKKYDEKDGEEKKHEEEGGYQEEHHEDEKGEKAAGFGEKGEHKKGHSTHGEHSVHKKDEYEKKTEFFDEFHEGGDVEKHGEHHHEHESHKGGHEKKGHHDAADHEEEHGKKEKHEKGGHHHEHKGHKVSEGNDHDYKHDEKYGGKKGHEHGKKWTFKKGDDR